MSSIGEMFKIGVGILRSIVDEKTRAVSFQIGDAITDTVDSDGVAHWQTIGVVSRPSKAEPGKRSAEAIVLRAFGHEISIATRDLRGLELAGSLGDGETCIYAGGEDGKAQGRILIKKNGNVALYTAKGNVAGGDSVTVQVNADGEIHVGSPFGGLSITEDKLVIAHKSGAAIELAGGNITFIGTAIALNGASVSIGANAAMPVVWGPAGIAGVGSTSVKVAI